MFCNFSIYIFIHLNTNENANDNRRLSQLSQTRINTQDLRPKTQLNTPVTERYGEMVHMSQTAVSV